MLSSRLVDHQLKLDSMIYLDFAVSFLLQDILLFTLNVIDYIIVSAFVFTETPIWVTLCL